MLVDQALPIFDQCQDTIFVLDENGTFIDGYQYLARMGLTGTAYITIGVTAAEAYTMVQVEADYTLTPIKTVKPKDTNWVSFSIKKKIHLDFDKHRTIQKHRMIFRY